MGLALAILIGFLGVVGVSHHGALAHKHLKQVQPKKKPMNHPKKTIVLLDGVEVKNLKGN
jgi:DeoR/GlpR family transcriptional regulator of sugar metabolism